MSEESEKFIYFINNRRSSSGNNVELRPRQVTREEWEASWLSWWNKVEAGRRSEVTENSE